MLKRAPSHLTTFALLAVLLLSTSSYARPEASLHGEDGKVILTVRPEHGPVWTRTVASSFFIPELLTTDDGVVVWSSILSTEIQIFDWTGKAFPSMSLEQNLSALWSSGEMLVALEQQSYGRLEQLVPSAGTQLWIGAPGETRMRPVRSGEVDALLRDAPSSVALGWYGLHAQRPPESFQRADLDSLQKLGLEAARGDKGARAELLERMSRATDDLASVARALALSGPEVLRPALLKKAEQLVSGGSSHSELGEWGLAVQSLRSEFDQLPLESMPAEVLPYLPSRAAWENHERLMRMVAGGEPAAAEAVGSSIGPWAPELPARLLAMPEFPLQPVLRVLHFGELYPGTVPLLVTRLGEHETVYDALRWQSRTLLPDDPDLWKSWWGAQNGQPPSERTPAYAWVMHSLAQQGRLTPEVLARHPRLIARLSLPVPCGISANGKRLQSFPALRGALKPVDFDLAGSALPATGEAPSHWGVFSQEDPVVGSALVFVADGRRVTVSLDALRRSPALQSPELARWLPDREQTVLLSGRGIVKASPHDLDPELERFAWAGEGGIHVVDIEEGRDRVLEGGGWPRFLPGGGILIVGGDGGEVLHPSRKVVLSTNPQERVAAFTGELAILSTENAMRVVHTGSGNTVRAWSGVFPMNFSISEEGRVVLGDGQTLDLFEVTTGTVRHIPRLSEGGDVPMPALDSSGRFLSVSDASGAVSVWDLHPVAEPFTATAQAAVERWTGTRWVEGRAEPLVAH